MCLPIIGGIISGVGAAMGAAGQAAQAEGQANMDRRQAEIEAVTGGYKAARTQDNVDRVAGAQRAGFAANGVGMSGSAADVIQDSAEEGALDVAAIRWNSGLQQDNSRYSAKLNDMNAKIATAAIPFAFATPVINGFTDMAKFGGSF